jgi:hypothetical protein
MSAYKIYPIRLISAVVMTCFVMQEAVWAAPMSAAAAQPMPLPPPMAISQFINDPARINMPLEHVTVQEIHPGTNGKLIIHIQDAHANLSGQQSLAKALDKLLSQYDLRLVLVEGSARDSSLDEIRKLAPLKEWSIIARRFLYEGIISGEEYLNLTTEHPMKIIGVEYRDLYDEAVKAYAAIVDRRKDILHYLYQAKVSLDRLKVRMYPRELRDYEARKGPNDGTSTLDFKSGFADLMKLAEQAEYPLTDLPQVRKLKDLMDKESLVDFEKAGKEQEAILKGLSVAGADEEVREFTEASRRLRYSQVSQYLLVQKLLQTASNREVAIENFPELMAYAGYLEKFTDLKMEALMSELEYLEDKVYEKLLPDDETRKVRAIDRFLGLLGNAYKLQMSSHDFGMFTYNEKDFKTEGWLAFMNRQLVDLGFFESLVPYKSYLEDARSDFGHFYQLVGERDNAFVENAERIMSEQHENAAVLIAGGYHTAHLTELLRKEGTSYIVLTPVVTDTTDHERYEDLLLSHLRDQEKRLAASGSAKKDTAPYRAQNVAQTKIPRGLRLISYGSRLAAGEMPGLNIIESRLPNMVEPFREAAARFTDRLQLNSAARMAEPIAFDSPAAATADYVWEILPPDKGGFPVDEIKQGANRIADFLRQHVGGWVSGQTIPVESAPKDPGAEPGTFVMANLSEEVPVAPSRIVSPRVQDELLTGLRNASQKILSSWASEGRAPGIVHIPVARKGGETDDDFRERLQKMAENLIHFTNPTRPIAYPIFVMKDRSSGNLVPVQDDRFDIDLDASIVKAIVQKAGLSDYRAQAQNLMEKDGSVPITLISEQFESLWLEIGPKSAGGLVRIDGDDLIGEPHHVLLAATLSLKDGASLSLPLWNSLLAEKDPNSPIDEQVASEFRNGTTDAVKLKRFALNALSSLSGVVERASRSLIQALQSA